MTQNDPQDFGELSFEKLLEQVEGLVGEMQEGGLPLEAMLEKYEQGFKMLAAANSRLSRARARLEELRPGGELED